MLRPVSFFAVVLPYSGCASRHELTDVPVEGATADQLLEIEAELRAFSVWSGHMAPELSHVRLLADVGEDRSGSTMSPPSASTSRAA